MNECQAAIERSMRQIFEQTLPDRIRRYLEVKPHPIVANHHFSEASAESIELFRDGHFYGCIALVQAVAESLVKFVCLRNHWNPGKNFENNVKKLATRHFVSEDAKGRLLQIWDKRDDYHHLNPSVETDRKKLEDLAEEKLRLLNNVEAEIFAFTFVDQKIAPTYPQYWDIKDGKSEIYLRCD